MGDLLITVLAASIGFMNSWFFFLICNRGLHVESFLGPVPSNKPSRSASSRDDTASKDPRLWWLMLLALPILLPLVLVVLSPVLYLLIAPFTRTERIR